MKLLWSALASLIFVGTASAGTAQQNYDNHLLVLKQMNACAAFYGRSMQSSRENGKKVMADNLALFRSKVDEYASVNNLMRENKEAQGAWQAHYFTPSEIIQGYSVFSETHPTRKYCDDLANKVRPLKSEKAHEDWIAEGKANTKKLDKKYLYNSVSLQCVEIDNFCHESNTCDIPYRIGEKIKIDVSNQEFFDLSKNVHAYAISMAYHPLSEQQFFSDLNISTNYNLPEISFLEVERNNGQDKVKRRHIFAPRFTDPLKNKFTGKMHQGDVQYDYRISVYPESGSPKMSYMRGVCKLTGYNQ